MAKAPRGNNTFWKTLLRMEVFWLSSILLSVALVIGYVYLRAIGSSPGQILFSLIFAFFVSTPIIIYACYGLYAGKPTFFVQIIQQDDRGEFDRSATLREILATIPLLLGAVGALYFFATGRLRYILVVLIVTVGLWQLLRFLLRSKTRRLL